MSITTVPKKIRLIQCADRANNPIAQAADALTAVFPRVRLVLGHIGTLPEKEQKRLMDPAAVLLSFVRHIGVPDSDFIAAIDEIIDSVEEASPWDGDGYAQRIIIEELAAVRVTLLNVMDRA